MKHYDRLSSDLINSDHLRNHTEPYGKDESTSQTGSQTANHVVTLTEAWRRATYIGAQQKSSRLDPREVYDATLVPL